MNFTETQLFQDANLNLHETFTETDALRRIVKSLAEPHQFKYFVIETEENTRINLKWLVEGIRQAYAAHSNLQRLKIIVMMNTVIPDIIMDCTQLEITYGIKPTSLVELNSLLNSDVAATPLTTAIGEVT
jgi:hypothetical protein